MSAREAHTTSSDSSGRKVDFNLEVTIIPVTDVDRTREFYERAGWKLDRDIAPFDGLRLVQFTPPGSGTSVTFGVGLTTAAPGSHTAELVVSDIEAAHDELAARGIKVSDFCARRAVPGPDPAAWPPPDAGELPVVLLFRRPRRQHMAGPGGHVAGLGAAEGVAGNVGCRPPIEPTTHGASRRRPKCGRNSADLGRSPLDSIGLELASEPLADTAESRESSVSSRS